jgi:quercetin dioxygenase-like cupin family protein
MSKGKHYTWNEIPATELTPKIKRRLVSGEKAMSVHFTLTAGAALAEHQHPHEQITHLLSGKIALIISGEKIIVQGGDVVVIPSNAPHSVEVLEDSVAIDLFSPPREDFLADAPPTYMEE